MTTRSSHLFLDDERWPADVTWLDLRHPLDQWQIVRSFDQAVQWTLQHGFPDVVSFDHDLGIDAGTAEKSGYDFARWLVEYDMDTGAMPCNFSFTVHSKNPVGARNIAMYLDNYIKQKGK